MAQNMTGKQGGSWLADSRLTKVPVIICTISGVYSGLTYCLPDQRLLDALNEGFSSRALRMGKEFVPLTDVQAYFPTGTKVPLASRYKSTYIRKTNIFFVGEMSRRKSEIEVESKEKPKPHRVKAKKPIAAEIHMTPYILKGELYADMWQELLQALDRDERFLPLTNVTVWPELADGESRFDFAAVNKDQIIYLSESPR